MLAGHKLVWIDNKKAGSSTIATLLRDFFDRNASMLVGCDDAFTDVRRAYCPQYGPRYCFTLCLSHATLSRYIHFAFVRDPVARFYSALSTATDRVASPHYREPTTYAGVARMLEGMRDGKCTLAGGKRFNVHLESQSLSLSSAALWRPPAIANNYSHHLAQSGPRYMVPLDFIGRIEHLADDFLELVDLIEKVNGVPPLTPERRRALEAKLRSSSAPMASRPLPTRVGTTVGPNLVNVRTAKGSALEQRIRNASLDELVRRTYGQDVACGFGVV